MTPPTLNLATMHTSGIEACRLDLYTSDADLDAKYPPDTAAKVRRVRALHQWFLSRPSASDAECVREAVGRFGVSRPTAYDDLRILKALLPHMAQASKDFHRWRYGEMILATYEMARARADTRTMERAATSYARYHAIDREDTKDIPVDQLIPQGFYPVSDPSVLGIKPIPNLRERQRHLLEKYLRETQDIEDIDYEPVDLDEAALFAPLDPLDIKPSALNPKPATDPLLTIDDS